MMGRYGNQRVRQRDQQCHPKLPDPWDSDVSAPRETYERRLECERPGNDSIGWCKLFGHWCGTGSEWVHCRGYSGWRQSTYQPIWTQCYIDGHQPGSAGEGESDASDHHFSMHSPLDQWHLDQKSMAENENSMWDACAKKIGDSLGADCEICLDLGCKVD